MIHAPRVPSLRTMNIPYSSRSAPYIGANTRMLGDTPKHSSDPNPIGQTHRRAGGITHLPMRASWLTITFSTHNTSKSLRVSYSGVDCPSGQTNQRQISSQSIHNHTHYSHSITCLTLVRSRFPTKQVNKQAQFNTNTNNSPWLITNELLNAITCLSQTNLTSFFILTGVTTLKLHSPTPGSI